MTLRNKPGLSIVLRDSPLGIKCAGWIVEVLYRAPSEVFALPDGQVTSGADVPAWVVKLPHVVRMPGFNPSRYAMGQDTGMRPIDGGGITAEDVRDLYAPSPERACQ